MTLISRLTQEITDEEKLAGESQCFIGHEFRSRDLRAKLERVLKHFDLEAYFADHEVTGDYVLNKVCKRIMVTRASIVDLTEANPNVYFELGVAIGLNKPVFVVLKRGTVVPSLLDSFVKLRFTSYAGLEKELIEHIPDWLAKSLEYHLLYTTHCHFVNVLCPDRQRINPQRQYLVIDQVDSIDEIGQHIAIPDPDLYAELPDTLDKFHFAPIFLDEVLPEGNFHLCDYCRILRSSTFSFCHLTQQTVPGVYLLLGLAIGLDIPSLMLVHEEVGKDGKPIFEVPTMLRGLDAFCYEHTVDIDDVLADRVELFLNRVRSRPLADRRLLFPDARSRLEFEPASELTIFVNVSEILGQPVAVVTNILGTPKSTDVNNYRLLNEYQVGQETIQIEFHSDIAVFVSCEMKTFTLAEDIAALEQLGLSLPPTPPTIVNTQMHLKRWEPFEPYARLTVYYDDDNHFIESVTILVEADSASARIVDDKRHSVLVVEDAPNWRELYNTLLGDDYLVVFASSYSEARKALLVQSPSFQVAILDLHLSHTDLSNDDGLRILELIKRTNPSTDVIIITGYPTVGLTRNAFELGAFGFLTKGEFDVEQFRNLVKESMDKSEQGSTKLEDIASLRQAFAVAQSIADPDQLVQEMRIVIEGMARVRDTEGIRRVVEFALSMEQAELQEQILIAGARIYRILGEEEKARAIENLHRNKPIVSEVDLASGVVCIQAMDGSIVGSGFIVSSDRLIATCASVARAAGAGPGERIFIRFHGSDDITQALVLPGHWLEQQDVAILQVEGELPSDARILPLGASQASAGHFFKTFGFSTSMKEGFEGTGEITGETSSRGQRFTQLRTHDLPEGFGGAPIWDMEENQVIGMTSMVIVTNKSTRWDNVAFAVPAETVQSALSVVRVSLHEAQAYTVGKRLPTDREWEEAVHVPAGEFLYGYGKERRILSDFWIDRTPVTNAEYARFVAATGYASPNHWMNGIPLQEIADHPVTQVSWYDAKAYAEWAGKRLPTEEEWEKAARGTDGRLYPWGDEAPSTDLCNFGKNTGATTPVGKYSPQGDSPYGVTDMAGNVWEWTGSFYDTGEKRRVLRGGCWDNEPLNVRAAYRISNTPESRGPVMGFRCVRDSDGAVQP